MFLGCKGAGKSTMAAALHARGHSLISDDVVPVDLTADSGPIAIPGFPRLKLRPEATTVLSAAERDGLPEAHPGAGKLACGAGDGFSLDPRRIACLYVLEVGSDLAVKPVSSRDAFVELIGNTYGIGRLEDKSQIAASTMAAYTRLIREIPVRRLVRPACLDRLPDVAGLVEKDCGALA